MLTLNLLDYWRRSGGGNIHSQPSCNNIRLRTNPLDCEYGNQERLYHNRRYGYRGLTRNFHFYLLWEALPCEVCR